MAERFSCAICLSFSSDSRSDYFVSTKGGHIFHYSCIKRVIDRDEFPTCPVCREPLSFATLTRLYGIESPDIEEIPRKNPDAPCDHAFKIVVLGDSGVGKSALLRRFADNEFQPNMVTTIGCDLLFKFVDMGGKTVKLNMWDTAGDEKYRAIIPSYVRNAHAIFLVYSITDIITFNHVQDWLKFAIDHGPENAVRVLIGNKCDQEDIRMVPVRRAKELSQSEGIPFFETSAKEAHNIEAALRTATAEIMEKPDLVQAADSITARSRRRLVYTEYSAEPPPTVSCC